MTARDLLFALAYTALNAVSFHVVLPLFALAVRLKEVAG